MKLIQNKNIMLNAKSLLSIWGLVLMLFVSQLSVAQSPKREMRATWLTTVWRLDWPSVTVPKATGNNEAQRQAAIQTQKNDLIRILDALKAANMNAAFFQIRSMCDAMYPSSYEPWSQFISSERGADPGYDPLAFAIEEAHKRGIELHAWLNPYRYSTSQSTHGELANDYFHTNRDWLLAYDSYQKILNPGLPEVVKQIKKVVGEVINNYDVDGIIFDDYFYAYGGTSNTFDAAAQALYRPAGKDLGDWRRENVNRMIAQVYDTIQKVKPHVTFGVSPFGTWTTDVNIAASRGITLPSGVGTTGDMYKQIYCDPVAWLEEGTVDYISPQLYWTTFSAYPYGKLAPWWSELSNRFGKHFYSSHKIGDVSSTASSMPKANSKISLHNEEIPVTGFSTLELQAIARNSDIQKAPTATNYNISEIGLQIDFNRTGDINDAPGSVFYATAKLVNMAGFVDYLKNNKFQKPALAPAIAWKKTETPEMVSNIQASGQNITWQHSSNSARFAIYAVPNDKRNQPNVFFSSEFYLGMSYSKSYTLAAGISTSTHKIAVSTIDRYGNESAVIVMDESLATGIKPTITFPANNAQILFPAMLKCLAVPNTQQYVWQLATDAQFNNIVFTRETASPEFFSGLQTNLKDDVNYYLRVKARIANAPEIWSDAKMFSGHKFRINSPAKGSDNVSMTPKIEWDSISPTAVYTLQVATASDFASNKIVINQQANAPRYIVPNNILLSNTLYYARVSVVDGTVQAMTEVSTFTTRELEVPVPTIISPQHESTVNGTSINLCWAEQNSNGFRIEMSKDPAFPGRGTTIRNTDAFTYCTTFSNLTQGVYYFRMQALRSATLTAYSNVLSVTLNPSTSVGNNWLGTTKCYISYENGRQLIVNIAQTLHAQIDIFNSTGLRVGSWNSSLQNGINYFDISNIQNGGLYLIKIESNNQSQTFKIRL